jgi:hypothetical protein
VDRWVVKDVPQKEMSPLCGGLCEPHLTFLVSWAFLVGDFWEDKLFISLGEPVRRDPFS